MKPTHLLPRQLTLLAYEKQMLDDYLRDVRQVMEVTPEEMASLQGMLRSRNAQQIAYAKRRLVEAHLKVVFNIALQYVGFGVSFLDLIQEGNLGLLAAARKYQPNGSFFGRYVQDQARFAIWRVLNCHRAKVLHLPEKVGILVTKLHRYLAVHDITLGSLENPAILKSVAENLEVPQEEIALIVRYCLEPLWFGEPITGDEEEENRHVEDTIADPQAVYKLHDPWHGVLAQVLGKAIEKLTPIQQRVLCLYYGFTSDGDCYTHVEISRLVGWKSPTMSLKVLQQALATLRRPDVQLYIGKLKSQEQ